MRWLDANFVGNGVSAAKEEEGDEGVGGRGGEDGRLGRGGGVRVVCGWVEGGDEREEDRGGRLGGLGGWVSLMEKGWGWSFLVFCVRESFFGGVVVRRWSDIGAL